MNNTTLIPDFNHIADDDFTDFFSIIAKNIEDSLIQSGAKPSKDYTILDLYNLAQPFALTKFKDLEYTQDWKHLSDD
jgi:hypothetical protein